MVLTLRTLLRRLPPGWGTLATDATVPERTLVSGVAEDSRRVRRGFVFVAHAGRGTDGHQYVEEALDAGAVAVVGEAARKEIGALAGSPVPYWRAADGRLAFALLSAAFYDFPARRMRVIGVTGTDGKTTTSTLAHSVLSAHGLRTGLITTVAARIDDQEIDTGFHTTTPEAFDLQGYLARMEDAGCQAVVLETTSHALDQERVACIDYDTAVVTNVTHEHLDWHGTWDNYMAAKARLFRALDASRRKPGIAKTAVLNLEDRSYPILRDIAADRTITYAVDPDAGAMVSARDVVVSDEGTAFRLVTREGMADAWIAPIGAHNVANALAAAAVGLSVGASPEEIVHGLGAVKRVTGRMEYVYRGTFRVIVDFAHTPNALARTIGAARALVAPGGRVIVVFGSAGLRDVEKRRLMGEVACAADLSVLTAEDPRTEDVNDIIDAIASGLLASSKREGVDFLRVPDRAEAIETAIGQARPGDLVICCGKAHERSMAYGTVETPWDEFAAVAAALDRHHLSPA
jgi:UDP-N-acetylmuramoyl-L-alanyl-D-glutamate--2,6-diaminopimelate ligase